MSLCTRCGMNEPLPNDPDDFCRDCALETEAILETLTTGVGRSSSRLPREPQTPVVSVLDQPGPFYFRCEPCECGGNCEKCR
jgi:hypothetical protein